LIDIFLPPSEKRMRLEAEKCNGCGLCARECPLAAVALDAGGLPVFAEQCVRCGLCAALCPVAAITAPPNDHSAEEGSVCDHCPVACHIPASGVGACQRYRNVDGQIVHARPLLLPENVPLSEIYRDALTQQPVITAVGAGGTYPDYIPSPLAVSRTIDKVDVVTVVTESPLTYSSLLLKIDTDQFIGKEGAPVSYKGSQIGHVTTEQYGSKMISLGGINVMKTKSRLKTVKLIVGACNREEFSLAVEGGARLDLKIGESPVIDGKPSYAMKIACGAAIMGMFGEQLKPLADEIIVLDSDITGLFSEGHVGQQLGLRWRGIRPKGRYTTPGRYFGTPGTGWGGTDIDDPLSAFDVIDPARVFPGMRLLVLEVTGEHTAMLEADQAGRFHRVDVPGPAAELSRMISENKEPALTSGVYMGGCGGSARAGVSGNPVKLNRAVHSGKARLSIGGVPAYVLPGGGINFLVDVQKMRWRSFSWTPSPAVVAPIEYTMEIETYFALGGHKRKMHTLDDIVAEREIVRWDSTNHA
jgi:6-hydroxynicotinate reductase